MTTTMQQVDWWVLSPVLTLATGIVAVVIATAVTKHQTEPAKRPELVSAYFAFATVILAAICLPLSINQPGFGTFCVDPVQQIGCSYQSDNLTVALQGLTLFATTVILLLTISPSYANMRHHAGEFYVLVLAVTLGACLVVAARDLPTLVIAVELASIPMIGLVAARQTAASARAAVRLLMVAITSLGILTLGIAFIYAATGSMRYAEIANAFAIRPDNNAILLAELGVGVMVAGLVYKVGAAPFGWWAPDVYWSAPLPVVSMVATVSKIAGAGAVISVLSVMAPRITTATVTGWPLAVGALALFTMTVGNVAALRTRYPTTLLAWSAIAQAGWILLPFSGAASGYTQAGHASASYLIAYVIGVLAVLTVVILVSAATPHGSRHNLETYRGLTRSEPVASGILTIGLLILAGLPPGILGLIAKMMALEPVVGSKLWWFAIPAAINIAIGLVYYVRWIALLFAPPAPDAELPTWNVTVPQGVAVGAVGAAGISMSVLPHLLTLLA